MKKESLKNGATDEEGKDGAPPVMELELDIEPGWEEETEPGDPPAAPVELELNAIFLPINLSSASRNPSPDGGELTRTQRIGL